MLSGWMSWIVSVSAALMGPEDRMVDWVIGTRFLGKWVSGPSGAAIFYRELGIRLCVAASPARLGSVVWMLIRIHRQLLPNGDTIFRS
jgi:hypothetical protein